MASWRNKGQIKQKMIKHIDFMDNLKEELLKRDYV